MQGPKSGSFRSPVSPSPTGPVNQQPVPLPGGIPSPVSSRSLRQSPVAERQSPLRALDDMEVTVLRQVQPPKAGGDAGGPRRLVIPTGDTDGLDARIVEESPTQYSPPSSPDEPLPGPSRGALSAHPLKNKAIDPASNALRIALRFARANDTLSERVRRSLAQPENRKGMLRTLHKRLAQAPADGKASREQHVNSVAQGVVADSIRLFQRLEADALAAQAAKAGKK